MHSFVFAKNCSSCSSAFFAFELKRTAYVVKSSPGPSGGAALLWLMHAKVTPCFVPSIGVNVMPDQRLALSSRCKLLWPFITSRAFRVVVLRLMRRDPRLPAFHPACPAGTELASLLADSDWAGPFSYSNSCAVSLNSTSSSSSPVLVGSSLIFTSALGGAAADVDVADAGADVSLSAPNSDTGVPLAPPPNTLCNEGKPAPEDPKLNGAAADSRFAPFPALDALPNPPCPAAASAKPCGPDAPEPSPSPSTLGAGAGEPASVEASGCAGGSVLSSVSPLGTPSSLPAAASGQWSPPPSPAGSGALVAAAGAALSASCVLVTSDTRAKGLGFGLSAFGRLGLTKRLVASTAGSARAKVPCCSPSSSWSEGGSS
mmetsp:Transcript_14190/g.27213  ORF Transcript_14190/g.27213 Transcript_14190/m.27213 type:complete len:373 (-) Transcript_14190:226-1344(-)